MSDRIYLDHAATTPVLPEAREAVVEAYARWANPSSPHAEGRAAKAALEDARGRIKAAQAGIASHPNAVIGPYADGVGLIVGKARLVGIVMMEQCKDTIAWIEALQPR